MANVAAMDFAGRSVLVVGGSSGIGNAIAQRFRSAGATVRVWGTRSCKEDYAEKPGSDLEGLDYARVDVAESGSIEAADIPDTGLDALILSQGISFDSGQEYEIETFRAVLETNLTSVLRCATRCKASLAAAGGSVVILNSIASFRANRAKPGYDASKAGTMALTRTLAQAWARDGIRVNGIAPGFVKTDLTRAIFDDPDRRRSAERAVPLGRLGEVDEIASIALFLASPLASFIVGHTVVADGGMTL